MATLLYRIGRVAYQRRWLVVLLWALVLGVVGVANATSTGTPSSQVSIPGTEAMRANDLLAKKFPAAAGPEGATATLVLRAPHGERITNGANKKALEATLADVKDSSSRVAQVSDPFAGKTVSQDGTTAYAQVTYSVKATSLSSRDHSGLDKALESGRDRDLTVEASGSALGSSDAGGHSSEGIGLLLAVVILVLTLGSLIAAGLPLVTALVGVGISVAAISALSVPLNLPDSTTGLCTMLGLAVGIDYALFIVSRYRSERAGGLEPREAAARTNGTAGTAVVFAGLTVIIALMGLAVVNLSTLTAMGMGAAFAVAIAVLVATTLVPALLGILGGRIRGKAPKQSASRGKPAGAGLTQRWVGLLVRKPTQVLLVAVVGLGAIALPAAKLELNLPDDSTSPPSSTQHKAYDMLAQSFGAGFNGPLTVTVDDKDPAAVRAGAERLGKSFPGLADVANVAPAVFNESGDTAVIGIVPKSGPASDATKDLVHDIRELGKDVGADTGARAMVTGPTAINIDISDKFASAIFPYLAVVVGLSFLVLILVFRSILVPLKATLGFLLSVLAALGSLVAVFQWGWLKDLFGVEQTGPIMSLMPIMMVGIVFGLAMDYQVFLVTRIREDYARSGDPRGAIVSGFRQNATVVTAAALIMIAVFAGFATSGDVMLKAMGFGLAAAVFFDAFIVRLTIVPAALALLGKHAWSLPRWLDRIVPDVDVEGEKLARQTPTPDPAPREPVPSATSVNDRN
ncbi:MMPL family transporter [Streptomyces sp. NPDC097107]|uniref:MMPL family transporter n=1 Tax=Streptomyces sp. NPDC097107 TaxID=3366089 RepID=UPI0037FD986C